MVALSCSLSTGKTGGRGVMFNVVNLISKEKKKRGRRGKEKGGGEWRWRERKEKRQEGKEKKNECLCSGVKEQLRAEENEETMVKCPRGLVSQHSVALLPLLSLLH